MTFEICKYHGAYFSTFEDSIPNGTIYAVKKEEDLTNLVTEFITPPLDITNLTSIDLKERNIFFIYIKEGGGQYKHYIKRINCNNSELNVSIINPTLPGILNHCTLEGKVFVISSLKHYDENKIKIIFENSNIYNEPEFKDFQKSNAEQPIYKDEGKKLLDDTYKKKLWDHLKDQSLRCDNLIKRLSQGPEITST